MAGAHLKLAAFGAAYPRAQMQAQVLAWMERGMSLKRVAELDGFPCVGTVLRWAREEPAFAAQLREARIVRRGVLSEGKTAWNAFHPERAEAFLLEMRRGATVGALLRQGRAAGWPGRRTYLEWRRLRPDFAEGVREALRFSREVQAMAKTWGRGRRWAAFDQAAADRIIVRLAKGEMWASLLADPSLPGKRALLRWKRRRPEFAGALGMAARAGKRARAAAAGGPPRTVVAELLARIEAGGAMSEVCAAPDMPAATTVYGWMRRDPEFAQIVRHACRVRDWALGEQACEIAGAATADNLAQARAQVAALRWRLGSMTPKPRRPRPV